MRRVCLLVVLFGSWCFSLGQSAPKLTVPKIVAAFERLNQTSPISLTKVFTPQHWGTFQVSVVMVETVAGGEGIWNGQFFWRDGGGDEGNGLPLGTTRRGSVSIIWAGRMKAGTPFEFSINAVNSPGGKYNVWIVVEQLM
jgi:hypothetical protein